MLSHKYPRLPYNLPSRWKHRDGQFFFPWNKIWRNSVGICWCFRLATPSLRNPTFLSFKVSKLSVFVKHGWNVSWFKQKVSLTSQCNRKDLLESKQPHVLGPDDPTTIDPKIPMLPMPRPVVDTLWQSSQKDLILSNARGLRVYWEVWKNSYGESNGEIGQSYSHSVLPHIANGCTCQIAIYIMFFCTCQQL